MAKSRYPIVFISLGMQQQLVFGPSHTMKKRPRSVSGLVLLQRFVPPSSAWLQYLFFLALHRNGEREVLPEGSLAQLCCDYLTSGEVYVSLMT